jgi:hypothetical protein
MQMTRSWKTAKNFFPIARSRSFAAQEKIIPRFPGSQAAPDFPAGREKNYAPHNSDAS